MQTTSSQKPKIPKLRFPKFSEEWKEKRLYDCTDRIWIGLVTTMTTNYAKSGTRLIRNSNIKENRIEDDNPIYLERGFADKHKNRSLLKGDIVTVHTGDVGTSAIIDEEFNGAQGFATLNTRVDVGELHNKYLCYFLNSHKYKNWALRFSTGDGRNNLNMYDFVKSKIPITSLPEQQKIASFLTSVNECISNLKAQKESLESYKKGMKQKLFSQEIRFKDENGNDFPKWEEKKLGDLLDYEQPTKYIVESTEYSDNYDIPVLTAGKTFILGYTNEINGVFAQEDLPVIIFDDFTTASQFVDFQFKVKSSAMKILKTKNCANIRFIYEAMQRIRYEVGGHGRHWISKFSNLKIKTPSLPEQQEIADFLSSIDSLINSKQLQISKAEEWKRGLMQGLFV